MIDAIDLTKALIAAPSVTPATGEVFDVLEGALAAIGFDVHRAVEGEAPDGPDQAMARTSRSRGILMSSPPAKAGQATHSRLKYVAACSMGAVRLI
jgi:acetylornithine deacetylase/succinyl-diaminopimelate desuccinylase-like protein